MASVAQEHGAEVMDLGAIGTRQGGIDPLIRQMPSHAKPRLCVDAAGPCGTWRYRYLTNKGDDCWGVAPSVIPKTAGDRVTTDRRAALPLARWARSGDLTAVDGPTVDAEAMRVLTRAREDAISDRQDATCRLHAFVLRQASRYVSRATGGPAHFRWLSAGVCPTPAPPSVLPA